MNNSHPITAFVSAITGVRTIARLKLREQSRATKLRQWQEVRLRRLLQYAYREVPYYHQSFDDASMRPGDIRSIDELRSLPVLTRENVLTHADELVSREAAAQKRPPLIPIRTTGSSGIPLQVWLSQREYFQSLSHVLHGFLSAGASITDTFVHIHVPLNKAQHFAFERLGFLRQVHLDLRLGEHSTLAELRQLDAPVVYSFPSYLLLMANVVLQEKVSPPRMKLIVTNGEILTQEVRTRIHQAFRCPVFDSYGAAEIFRIASECRQQKLHILPDSSVVEVDESTRQPDGSADIIVTPLYLRSMPLIRYKLGDRIVLSDERCACGSSWPVIGSVAGRSDDYLTLPSGKQISPRAINLLEGVPGIAEYQIIQKSRSDFEVNIRPTSRFGPLSHEQVKQIIATGCAPESVQVNIYVVETLVRAATGKLNTVVSQVDR